MKTAFLPIYALTSSNITLLLLLLLLRDNWMATVPLLSIQ